MMSLAACVTGFFLDRLFGDPAKFLFCDLTVKVHRTVLTAKMEADIIIPVCGVDQP